MQQEVPKEEPAAVLEVPQVGEGKRRRRRRKRQVVYKAPSKKRKRKRSKKNSAASFKAFVKKRHLPIPTYNF
jgi:hypothetical protein